VYEYVHILILRYLRCQHVKKLKNNPYFLKYLYNTSILVHIK